MANLGYIQVVRHCNHFCGFCSNPATPYTHTLESMRVLVDDFVRRGYFGVILTGGEPTLHPDLPAIAAHAAACGLHVRMITNGSRLADPAFARAMADAGLKLVHVSIYSVRPDVEARLRGQPGTLPAAFAAIDNARACGIEVNVNCVINRLNADHLDDNVRHLLAHHPHVRHFVWNNLDPSMGRAEVNQAQFTPRLADFELSLGRAMRLLDQTGRSFRVEKVPLCYLGEYAWASTETRKIIKGEERIVHFLDAKQSVRQTEWTHLYAPGCRACSLRPVCGGLFDRGGTPPAGGTTSAGGAFTSAGGASTSTSAYDPAELAPQFVDPEPLVRAVLDDPRDPSPTRVRLADWQAVFAGRADAVPAPDPDLVPDIAVGALTDHGQRRYAAKRRSEARLAEAHGVAQEPDLPGEPRRA